jgi:hypothetical protein
MLCSKTIPTLSTHSDSHAVHPRRGIYTRVFWIFYIYCRRNNLILFFFISFVLLAIWKKRPLKTLPGKCCMNLLYSTRHAHDCLFFGWLIGVKHATRDVRDTMVLKGCKFFYQQHLESIDGAWQTLLWLWYGGAVHAWVPRNCETLYSTLLWFMKKSTSDTVLHHRVLSWPRRFAVREHAGQGQPGTGFNLWILFWTSGDQIDRRNQLENQPHAASAYLPVRHIAASPHRSVSCSPICPTIV